MICSYSYREEKRKSSFFVDYIDTVLPDLVPFWLMNLVLFSWFFIKISEIKLNWIKCGENILFYDCKRYIISIWYIIYIIYDISRINI